MLEDFVKNCVTYRRKLNLTQTFENISLAKWLKTAEQLERFHQVVIQL